MGTAGPTFYDDDTVFATYQQGRQRPDNPNDTLEKPVILELSSDIAGKACLIWAVAMPRSGASFSKMVRLPILGVDGSAMVALATQTLAGTAGRLSTTPSKIG